MEQLNTIMTSTTLVEKDDNTIGADTSAATFDTVQYCMDMETTVSTTVSKTNNLYHTDSIVNERKNNLGMVPETTTTTTTATVVSNQNLLQVPIEPKRVQSDSSVSWNNDTNNIDFSSAYENDDDEATACNDGYESRIMHKRQQQSLDTNSIFERTIQSNNDNINNNISDLDIGYAILQKNDLYGIENTIQNNNEKKKSKTRNSKDIVNLSRVFDPNSSTQQQELQQQQHDDNDDNDDNNDNNDNHIETWINTIQHVLFISSYGIIGTVIRYYLGRLFGYDCEMKSLRNFVHANDFFSIISSNICITSSGKTLQTGSGSLFIDLPANMIGSFIMGMVSPSSGQHTIPWLRSDHHLQDNKYFHNGLRIGTCGCLTTFSSWNTQMVIMLDGTGTVLGSQILSAIFGYIIGTSCSLSSFTFGRTVAEWMKHIHHHVPNNDDNDNNDDVIVVELPKRIEQQEKNNDTYNMYDKKKRHCRNQLYCVNYGVQVLALLLVIVFVVCDFVYEFHMYRSVWLSLVLSPFGSIVRWKLSYLNNNKSGISVSSSSQCKNVMQWFPFGTFVCNVGAATVSIIVAAVQYKLLLSHNSGGSISNVNNNNIWKIAILSAISIGWAGSTSTVSTLVREMADATTSFHSFVYCFVTIVSSAVVGLLLYRPIARW